jgi:hypothetical protein
MWVASEMPHEHFWAVLQLMFEELVYARQGCWSWSDLPRFAGQSKELEALVWALRYGRLMVGETSWPRLMLASSSLWASLAKHQMLRPQAVKEDLELRKRFPLW